MKIAFIGLGIMGSNMASHLAKNNLNLTVYNRTPKNFETLGIQISPLQIRFKMP